VFHLLQAPDRQKPHFKNWSGFGMILSHKDLKKILESVDCGIFTINTDCRITSWNRAAEKITDRASSR